MSKSNNRCSGDSSTRTWQSLSSCAPNCRNTSTRLRICNSFFHSIRNCYRSVYRNDAVVAISASDVLEYAVGLLSWTLRSAYTMRRHFLCLRASKSLSDENVSPGNGRHSSSQSETYTSSADTTLNSVSLTRFATASATAGSRSSPACVSSLRISLASADDLANICEFDWRTSVTFSYFVGHRLYHTVFVNHIAIHE